jgi:Uma2 family endonuclease
LGVVTGAETGYLVAKNPDTVLAPDVAFVRKDRLSAVGFPKAYFPEAPALVIEVVSPGDTVDKIDAKIRRWLMAGVDSVWVVRPADRSVTIYRLRDEAEVFTADQVLTDQSILPGFHCKVCEFFAPLRG